MLLPHQVADHGAGRHPHAGRCSCSASPVASAGHPVQAESTAKDTGTRNSTQNKLPRQTWKQGPLTPERPAWLWGDAAMAEGRKRAPQKAARQHTASSHTWHTLRGLTHGTSLPTKVTQTFENASTV